MLMNEMVVAIHREKMKEKSMNAEGRNRSSTFHRSDKKVRDVSAGEERMWGGRDRKQHEERSTGVLRREKMRERHQKKEVYAHTNNSSGTDGVPMEWKSPADPKQTFRKRRHSTRESSGDPRPNKRSRGHGDADESYLEVQSSQESMRRSKQDGSKLVPKEKEVIQGLLTTKTGGAYIPPARLRLMQAQITDKSSMEYQRIAWEALKKSINGLVNKVNVSNIAVIVRELFKENIVRGRGLLARSILQAQAASPTFAHVYAAFVAVINTKFPQTGELILRRLIIQFRRGFRRNDKQACISSTRFIAHLINQQVAHEVVALEILTLLLETPTDDSIEVAIGFLKVCGMKLVEVSPKGVCAIFERLRSILHEGQLDKRTQYMIEVVFAIRKDGFRDHPTVVPELDLIEEADQFTHLITIEDATNGEDMLNVFICDADYEANEEKYKSIRKEIIGDSDEDGSGGSGSESDNEDGDSEDEEGESGQQIVDETETNLVSLRRTIYLTIQSSLDFEVCAHKLLKLELKPGQVVELCHMILDCCAQQRTYEKFFGLLAQRFCRLNKMYVEPFEEIFKNAYHTIHRFETNKLRNVAKFFAHHLFTDAISWMVLSHIRLNEEETTSSSRIFVKILFQELCEYMELSKLMERVRDPTLQEAFDGLFSRDNPRNTRFALNFFTSIGLGGLTDDLWEHLRSMPKPVARVTPIIRVEEETSGSRKGRNKLSTSDRSSSHSSDGPSSSGSYSSSDSDSSSSDSSSSDSSTGTSSSSSSVSSGLRRRSRQKLWKHI